MPPRTRRPVRTTRTTRTTPQVQTPPELNPSIIQRFLGNLMPEMNEAIRIPVLNNQYDMGNIIPASEQDVKDVELPEPCQGSPFQRKGMAECIADDADYLTKHRLYRIEEINDDGSENMEFFIVDDRGGALHYHSAKLFRAIDHGPFRVNDIVKIDDVTGIMNGNRQLSSDYNGNQWIVLEQKDDQVRVQYGGGNIVAWVPCLQVKMVKRQRAVEENPFKKGDVVKVMKPIDKHARVQVGDILTVISIKEDRLAFEEVGLDYYYFHYHFKKHQRKVKRVFKKQVSMGDLIRKTVNENCYRKITPYEVLKILKEKMPTEEITINEVNKHMKHMFRW